MKEAALALLAAFLAMTGCATTGNTRGEPAAAGRHAPETDATPASWQVGSEWTFVVRAKDGDEQTFVFRVTDRRRGAHNAWVELETVRDPRPGLEVFDLVDDESEPSGQRVVSRGRFPSKVMARVDGRRLDVDLVTRVSDVQWRLVGELEGDRFHGVSVGSSLVGEPSVTPGVEGWRSR